MDLRPTIGADAFDALHDDAGAWRTLIEDIAQEHDSGAVTQALDGTVLVGLTETIAVKLYPPFLADHFAFEVAALELLHGVLSVATPRLLAVGQRATWPYLVMTRLSGESLEAAWPRLSEMERIAIMESIGAVMAEVHALGAASMTRLAPLWSNFIARQIAGCRARQDRTGLPPHLGAQVDDFIGGIADRDGDDVILTGEYTPMNLFVGDGANLCAMFDFGDGLIGPRHYDWLGPTCFLAAGRRQRYEAFLRGYDATPIDPRELMRLLLLHRYSNLAAQVRMDGWEAARDLESLSELIWPCR